MPQIVTLDEAKAYCHIATANVDDALTLLLDSAEDWVAAQCCTAFSVTPYTERHDGGRPYLWLARRPVVSITSVVDLFDGNETLDATDYSLRGNLLAYAADGDTPTAWPSGWHRWEVTYTAGYNDGDTSPPDGSTSAPEGLRAAVLGLVRRLYEGKGGIASQSTANVTTNWDRLADGEIMALLQPYRLGGDLL